MAMTGAATASRGRVRTPDLLQMEAAECGAAALGIVLGYHGRWEPLEALRIACGVSRDGSTAANIMAAAGRYGLEAEARRVEVDDVSRLPVPCILFWNMDHFVVLEGRSGVQFRINDPASGRRPVGAAEFGKAFSGVALCFTPGSGFRKAGRPADGMAGFGRLLGDRRRAFLWLLLTALVLALPGIAVPLLGGLFVDDVIAIGFDDRGRSLILALLVMAGLSMVILWLQAGLLLRLETRISVTAAWQFLDHALRLPIAFFAQRRPGEIGARLLAGDRIARLLAGELAPAVLHLVAALPLLAVMLVLDALLTAVVVAFALLNAVLLARAGALLRERDHLRLADAARFQGMARHGLQMIESVKATGSDQQLFARLLGLQSRMLMAGQGRAVTEAVLAALPLLLFTLAAAAVLVLGGHRVIDGTMTAGMLVAFFGMALGFALPVARLVGLAAHMQEARAGLAALDDALNRPQASEFTMAETAGSGPTGQRLTGRIELRGVSFGHSPTEAPLLHDLDLVIEPGRRIALVGRSGCGKSTLAGLIAGLYRPWSGEVLVDGRRLEEISRDVLRQSVAVVDQHVSLFEGSVRDNIALWDNSLPDERLVECAKDAAIHDVILRRPGGYSARLSEDGGDLSGGQRARIEQARALAQRPRVLILDEATAALDPETERQVLQNLRRRGATQIIIAHRPGTLRDCDEILVLEQGRVAERGSPEVLLAAGGLYAELMRD